MIKRPIYLVISLILLVIVLGYSVERVLFLQSAQKTMGKVISLSAYNSRCGGRRNRHSCTKYDATVEFFTTDGVKWLLPISAGSHRGHNMPVSYADHKVNQPIPVIYSPTNPKKAYEDTLFGVWGGPLMLLFAQIGTFFSSFFEGRRRY